MSRSSVRRKPVQPRAEATFDRILDATALLLDREGVGPLTTNKIAEQADVNISVLYRYFSNKFEILEALAERTHGRARAAIESLGREATSSLRERLLAYVELLRTEPGLVPLSRALSALPELHAAQKRNKHRQVVAVSAFVADLVGARSVDPTVRTVAATLVYAASGVIDASLHESTKARKALIYELATMIEAYAARRQEDLAHAEQTR